MKKFLFFIRKTYLFALFVVLEVAAIDYYARSTSYTRARMVAATDVVAGAVNRRLSSVDDYFGLRRENDALTGEIARLRDEIGVLQGMVPDSVARDTSYVHMVATVITNTLTRPENFITLDKGRRDGVERNMAVITPQGTIVGWVMETRERTSVAISLLNTQFRTSGRIRGKDYLGSVLWQGRDADYATLSEIQKYAELHPGDTIVTEYSSRFPDDIVIGTVESWDMTNMGYFNVKVRLATKFASLNKVLLIKYSDIAERLEMEGFDPADSEQDDA